MNSGLRLAWCDAATNCYRDGALATITMRSGVQFTGKLKKMNDITDDTPHIQSDDGGWTTMLGEEVAAIRSHR